MKIGFIGLGKLGLPVALAIESRGNEVIGFDVNPKVSEYIKERCVPYKEEKIEQYLETTNIKHVSMKEVILNSEITFVAIQTPHDRRYEGITTLPKERRDFDYRYLKEAIKDIAILAEDNNIKPIIAIISTVLPGTINEQIIPIIKKYDNHIKLVYTPQFIAMGTTIRDFLYPEFVLVGVDDQEAAEKIDKFYFDTLTTDITITRERLGVCDCPSIFKCSIRTAEAIKVLYNTYITQKICFANAAMELCHYTGADVDDIIDCLSLGTRRIISPLYMRAGMGDGGGCHPRDNIALSYIARKYKISYDWWENLMLCREYQTKFLSDLTIKALYDYNLNTVILLGKAFKPETNLTDGSPALLLKNLLELEGLHPVILDPHIDYNYAERLILYCTQAVYVITTKHKEWIDFNFPKGSVVIDPWRYIPDKEGITILRIGEGKE